MYRRVRVVSRNPNPALTTAFETQGASFEIPMIFDYYITKGSRRPYAGLGVVAGHVTTGTLDSHGTAGGGIETPFTGQFFLQNQLPAYVANGGLEWNRSRVAIRPEVRYTRWSETPGLRVRTNQVQVSVGISLRRLTDPR